jgi:hypothetical protein
MSNKFQREGDPFQRMYPKNLHFDLIVPTVGTTDEFTATETLDFAIFRDALSNEKTLLLKCIILNSHCIFSALCTPQYCKQKINFLSKPGQCLIKYRIVIATGMLCEQFDKNPSRVIKTYLILGCFGNVMILIGLFPCLITVFSEISFVLLPNSVVLFLAFGRLWDQNFRAKNQDLQSCTTVSSLFENVLSSAVCC